MCFQTTSLYSNWPTVGRPMLCCLSLFLRILWGVPWIKANFFHDWDKTVPKKLKKQKVTERAGQVSKSSAPYLPSFLTMTQALEVILQYKTYFVYYTSNLLTFFLKVCCFTLHYNFGFNPGIAFPRKFKTNLQTERLVISMLTALLLLKEGRDQRQWV